MEYMGGYKRRAVTAKRGYEFVLRYRHVAPLFSYPEAVAMDFDHTFTYDNPIYAELPDVLRGVLNAYLPRHNLGDTIQSK